jgi:hypothetical protein
MVVESFTIANGLQHLSEQQTPIEDQPLEDHLGNENVIPKNLTRSKILLEIMIVKASTPLYKGSSTSVLLTILLLLNLRIVHVVSNAFMDEPFSLLWKELLPKDDKMSASTYRALKLNKAIGLSYDSIHACTNGCVLFQGTLLHSQMCPKRGTSRFVDGSRIIPRKVLLLTNRRSTEVQT